MSYNKLFDTFFSYWYIMFIFMALLLYAFTLLRKKYFREKMDDFWFWVFSGGLSFVILISYFLINPMYLGFGKAYGVSGISVSNGKVYVVDYILTGGDEVFGAMKYSRIHILDEKSGNKIRRFPAGEDGSLRGIVGDSLIFWHYNEADVFSAKTGKSISKWSNKTLPLLFPQLASGIDHTMIGDRGNTLELTTFDGNEWNLSLKSGKLWQNNPDSKRHEFVPSNQVFLNNDDEIQTNEEPGGRVILKLGGIGDNQQIKYLKHRDNSLANPNLKFIHGKFLALSRLSHNFVILGFETTKENSFILTGITSDGQKVLWELKQKSLRPKDNATNPISICHGFDEKSDILFFGINDEVLAIQLIDGKILWRQKL